LKGKAYREAAVPAASTAPKQLPNNGKAKSINGLVPEVYIDNLRLSSGVSNTASSAAEETADDDADSDLPSRKPRRVAAKKAILSLEDGESGSEVEEVKPSVSRKGASKRSKAAPKKKAVLSSDDEYSAEETDSDEGSEVESAVSSDDETSKRKAKAKAPAKKPAPNKKRKASTTSDEETTEDVAMDVDGPSSKPAGKKSVKKRSDGEDDERPAKKQKKRREDTDPWKLEFNSVKKDWTQMQAPPLEMFHFSRKVVDEYTYLDGKILSMVTNISADRHWVLSGTPPIHDFGALKTIAAFLNLHLGVNDDAEGQSAQVKKRRREQTGEC
jgi:hypothetical protein